MPRRCTAKVQEQITTNQQSHKILFICWNNQFRNQQPATTNMSLLEAANFLAWMFLSTEDLWIVFCVDIDNVIDIEVDRTSGRVAGASSKNKRGTTTHARTTSIMELCSNGLDNSSSTSDDRSLGSLWQVDNGMEDEEEQDENSFKGTAGGNRCHKQQDWYTC